MVALTILVTGTDRGIGLEFVRLLASTVVEPRPKLIIAGSLDPDSAEELTQLSLKFRDSPKIVIVRLDVTDESSIQSAFEITSALCGHDGLNLIINNAGVLPMKNTPELFSYDSMTENFRVNTVGPMILSKAFHPLLVTAARGKSPGVVGNCKAGIIMVSSNLASIADTVPGPLQDLMSFPYYGYKATKAALNMVMKSLSVEYSKDEILVSSIHPGWVQTEMGGQAAPLRVDESVRHIIATIAKMETGKFYNYDFAETGVYLPW